MAHSIIRATVRGSSINGVIHVGYRRWIVQQAITLNCSCIAENVGPTVKLLIEGQFAEAHILLAKARVGPPNSRVLSVTIDKEEAFNAME